MFQPVPLSIIDYAHLPPKVVICQGKISVLLFLTLQRNDGMLHYR
jgi:hypothetical protein